MVNNIITIYRDTLPDTVTLPDHGYLWAKTKTCFFNKSVRPNNVQNVYYVYFGGGVLIILIILIYLHGWVYYIVLTIYDD